MLAFFESKHYMIINLKSFSEHRRYYVIIAVFAKLPIFTFSFTVFFSFSIKRSDKRSKNNTTKNNKNNKESKNRKALTLRLDPDAEIPGKTTYIKDYNIIHINIMYFMNMMINTFH